MLVYLRQTGMISGIAILHDARKRGYSEPDEKVANLCFFRRGNPYCDLPVAFIATPVQPSIGKRPTLYQYHAKPDDSRRFGQQRLYVEHEQFRRGAA